MSSRNTWGWGVGWGGIEGRIEIKEKVSVCVGGGGGGGGKEKREGGGKTLSGDSTFQLLSSWTHSDERHFGLVTGTAVSPLQLLCFLKNRQKEVNNLGWF